MISMETLSFYIVICVLAPLIGAFTILFLFLFEKRLEALETHANQLVLEKELQTSKYDILSQKIQPHFFFNTLNMILSLARLDRKKELISSIETLAKFMKRKYMMDDSLATILDELTYTNYYLDIQKLRLGERLSIHTDLDPVAYTALIPPYVIQTLTENCFKHSFEKYEGRAELSISIRTKQDKVVLDVWNNKMTGETKFKSQAAVNPVTNGIGLQNIRDRMRLLYPENSTSLTLHDETDGTRVRMMWPLQYDSNKGGS